MNRSLVAKAWLRWLAGKNEVLMFSLALLFLVCLAVLMVLWVDLPSLQERATAAIDRQAIAAAEQMIRSTETLEHVVLSVMGGIWILVAAETITRWVTRPWNPETRPHHLFSLLILICPALRMCARSPEMHDRIWLPGWGWRRCDRRLKRQLERRFSIPMMVVALMIMPILIIEFFLKDQVAQYDWLRLLLHVGTGVIWFAFAAEFILKISVAERKLQYCKEHWIDLAIILLPVISFLRSLSVARTMRLTRLMRIQQLTKLGRAYRLRGIMIKAFRALVLLDLVERLFGGDPERRIAKLQYRADELEKQARLVRQKIARLRLDQESESADSPGPESPGAERSG